MTKDKVKILFVSRPIAPPWDEASKNFAYNLAKEVAKNNSDLEIHLMTKGILPNLPKNIIQHPIYTSSQNDFSFSQKLKALNFQFKNKKKFDIVHYFFTPTPLSSFLVKKIFGKKSKSIQTVATIREDIFSDKKIKKMMFGDVITTYSEYAKRKLEALNLNNVYKVYPGIDLKNYKLRTKNKKLLDKFKFSDSDFIINFSGEYVRLGAMDSVIDAFIGASKKIPKLKLSLAVRVKNKKDAHKKNKVIAKLKKYNLLKNVSFHDDGNYKMSDIYNLCDISLFPVENMRGKFDVPLAVIEAMACEKPVILSNIPILKEFANKKNSLTVEAGNVDELTQAILELHDNKEKRLAIGKQARQYVLENFSIKRADKEYTKLYKSL